MAETFPARADLGEGGLGRGELARTSLMAAALAFAGLPLYVYAPRYFSEEMGLTLPVLGAALLAARVVDSVQDPALGWLADRLRARREIWTALAALLLVAGFATLFAPPDWGAPMPRLLLGLLAAFTGFSALQIALYDHGLALAAREKGGHTRAALWREAGGLLGVCIASLAPPLFAALLGADLAYAGFAGLFVLVAGLAALAMAGRWRSFDASEAGGVGGFRAALSTPGVAAILGVGFVNALPTAVTATLFLFFVEDVLEADAHAGPTLLLFFLAAACAAPLWARLAEARGRRLALGVGMTLSILAFIGAYRLGAGDVAWFYAVALASGAALGADMTLTPAILAARIEGAGVSGGAKVFALWTFLQKTALALAAGLVLPALALAGFDPAEPVASAGRDALSAAYALLPCGLKLLAIAALAALPVHEGGST